MSTRPPFPLVWDNSMRSTLVACPRKFSWEYLDHYKPKAVSVHLHAGKAWAEGLEKARKAYYIDGIDEDLAEGIGLQALIHAYGSFECPPDSAKSLNRLVEAFAYYFQVFPMSTDPCQPYRGTGDPMIEFSFALPLADDVLHPETGEPIIYAGRADMVATYAGAVTIYDDKTTSSLGPSWANQWDLRSQFTGYTWAAREYNIPVTQVLVRGISILKTKLDHAQAISARNDYRVERWHGQVRRDILRAIEMWKEGYWDYNEADACSAFGGCMFRQPCQSQNPDPWLDTYFVRRKWDPVERTEILIGQETSAIVNSPEFQQWNKETP